MRVALDVSELGGMYAGYIKLIGTGAGLGVRNAGDIVAQAGEVLITSDGRLENAGFISGKNGVALASGDTVDNKGRLQSSGNIRITAADSLINRHEIVSSNSSAVTAGKGIHNSGAIYSAESLSLAASGASLENSGKIITESSLDLLARENFINQGEIHAGGALSVNAQSGRLQNSGIVVSLQDADLSGQTFFANLSGAKIHSGGNLQINALTGNFTNEASISSQGASSFYSGKYFSNSGETRSAGNLSLSAAGGDFINSGLILADADIIASSAFSLENHGTLRGMGGISLTAADFFINSANASILSGAIVYAGSSGQWNNAGLIESAGGFTFDSITGSFINSGRLSSNGAAVIEAGQRTVNTGQINISQEASIIANGSDFENTGRIVAGGPLNIKAFSKIINKDSIISLRDISLQAGNEDAQNSGEILSDGQLTINAFSYFLNNGIIESAKNLAVKALTSSFSNLGRIISGASASLTAASEFSNENHIQSLNDLVIKAGGGKLRNNGNILSGAGARLSATDDFRNSNTIHTSGGLEINSSGGSFINSGTALSGGNFKLASLIGIINSGSLQSSELLQASSLGAINNQALIFAGRGGTLRSALNFYNQSGASFLSGGELAVNTGGNLSNSGEFSFSGRFDLNVGQSLNNSGRILAKQSYMTAGQKFFNTGLLDGDELIIKAAEIENIFSGTILGGHVGLAAINIFNGLPLGQDGEGTAGFIGAREQLDIGFSGQLTNRENGLIYSAGDARIGGELDDRGYAKGKGGTLLNSSAMFDIGASLQADLRLFYNYNAHYSTRQEVSQNGYHGFQFAWQGDHRWYTIDEVTISGDYNSPVWNISSPYNHPPQFYMLTGTLNTTRTVPATSRPGMVEVGTDFYVNGNLTNDKSLIKTGGLFKQEGGNFNNIAAMEKTTSTFHGNHSREVWEKGHRTHKEVTAVNLPFSDVMEERDIVLTSFGKRNPGPSKLKDNGEVPGDAPAWEDLEAHSNPSASFPWLSPGLGQDAPVVNLGSLNTNVYTIKVDPSSGYLVESNPRLTSYRQWLGSDFMLSRLKGDHNVMHKRLGDGFYEQRLVREQISKLTGMRFLSGYKSDEEQFAALMSAGVEFAGKYDLAPGITLRPALP